MSKDELYWRCKCGEKRNLPDSLDCRFCGKQRWEHLGVTREQAELIVYAMQPVQ